MVAKKNIVFVDGFAIRNTLDNDFPIIAVRSTLISTEAQRFWVPEDEIWVDHRYKDEADFLIEVDTFVVPDKKENYAVKRQKAKLHFRVEGPIPNYIVRSDEGVSPVVRYVDGAIVRRHIDPEFILGGHDFVYDYIPRGEIWLDNKMDPKDTPYVLLHEQVERSLMAAGKQYHVAHEHASLTEMEFRRASGVGCYPGDPEYPWHGLSNAEIIQKHYLIPSAQGATAERVSVQKYIQGTGLCGPSSLRILLSHFGKEFSEEELAAYAQSSGTLDRGGGTEHEGMIEAAKRVGSFVFAKEEGTIDELEYFVKKEKLPVIIGWFDRDGDHYSVVVAMTERHIVIVDPASDEPERFLDRESFPKIWFDFVGKDEKIVSWGWYMVASFEKRNFDFNKLS